MLTRLGKNSLWLFAARLATQLLAVLFTILLARRFGSAGFGEYALLSATIFIGNILTTYGTDMLLMRQIAARHDLSQLPAALLLQLGLSLVFVLGVLLAAPFFSNQSPAARLGLQIYAMALFPLAFYTVFTTTLRGLEHMHTYALLGLAAGLLQIAAAALFPAGSIVAFATWMLINQILVALLAGVLCSVQVPGFWRGWRFSSRDLFNLFNASTPIALLSLLTMIYQKLSIYMLAGLGGALLTGWFSAALRAVEASKTAHISLFTALYPAMARAEPGSDKIFRQTRAALLALAAVLAAFLSWFAQPLIVLLFGSSFSPAIPALRILAWILLPYTLNTYFTLAFVAAHHEQRVAVALSGSLLALLLLNVWWIPAMGLAGAALAALAAESFQTVILLAQYGFHIGPIERKKTHEFSKLS